MNTRTSILVSMTLIVATLVVGLALMPRLPDPMASHWDINNQVDGYMPRLWAILFTPLVSLGLLGMFQLIPLIDPLKENIGKFRNYYNLLYVLLLFFLIYIHGLKLVWNLGYASFGMDSAMLPAMGLLFIAIGAMLGKAKRNWFIGIRTPWTLSSDTVWERTHQLGGKLFMLSGLLVVASIFLGSSGIWLMLAALLGSSLFLVLYSFILYQREEKS